MLIQLARRSIRMFREILRPLTGMVHSRFGKYQCSVCRRKVIGFRPLSRYYSKTFEKYGCKIGLAETCQLEQYSCPHCGSADRDRLYAIYLRRFIREGLDARNSFAMLDLAPNKSLSSFIVSEFAGLPNFHYRTADLYREGVDDKVDITDMHIYKEGQFDFFICSHMLEHVNDDRRAMGELLRILKKGGKGILMVPIDLTREEIDEDPDCSDTGERWRRFGQDDHVRAYSKQGFIDRILQAGFDLEQWDVEAFGAEEFVNHGIGKQSVLYIVEKSSSPVAEGNEALMSAQ